MVAPVTMFVDDVPAAIEEEESEDEDETTHLVCWCSDFFTLCGAYDEGDIDHEDLDGSECPECLSLIPEPCFRCGCRVWYDPPDMWCELCRTRGDMIYAARMI